MMTSLGLDAQFQGGRKFLPKAGDLTVLLGCYHVIQRGEIVKFGGWIFGKRSGGNNTSLKNITGSIPKFTNI